VGVAGGGGGGEAGGEASTQQLEVHDLC